MPAFTLLRGTRNTIDQAKPRASLIATRATPPRMSAEPMLVPRVGRIAFQLGRVAPTPAQTELGGLQHKFMLP